MREYPALWPDISIREISPAAHTACSVAAHTAWSTLPHYHTATLSCCYRLCAARLWYSVCATEQGSTLAVACVAAVCGSAVCHTGQCVVQSRAMVVVVEVEVEVGHTRRPQPTLAPHFSTGLHHLIFSYAAFSWIEDQ